MDRLRDAKQALFGQPNPEGRPRDSDEAALRWIGSEADNDSARVGMARLKGEKPPKPRSVRGLAREAVKRFGLLENAEERLRKKFSGTVAQKWIDFASLHDDIPEQIEHNALERIQKILDIQGITMKLDYIENWPKE